MLLDGKVEGRLLAISADGFQGRRAFTATSHDLYPPDGLHRRGTREPICIPPHLVPSSQQCSEIRQADSFSPSRLWVHRISPVEHQETHSLRWVFMAKTCLADNNKMLFF
jgi:hypothetical protein